jgi:hypothetical protein
VYASLEDARSEGVTASEAGDVRLTTLLDEATRTIDAVTGWFFEPRTLEFRLDGRGSRVLETPVPPLRLDAVADEWGPIEGATILDGAPVLPGFVGGRLGGAYFPKGRSNIRVRGLWGYTEADGTPLGRTPPAIRRACLLLALRGLAPLNDERSFDARSRWRIVEERTRDQSYRLGGWAGAGPSLTGDPEVDTLLAPYVRPRQFGAV